MIEVETDERCNVVLPGHSRQKFLVQENSDGSLLLVPAETVAAAQLEYDMSSELTDLLGRAAASPTRHVRRRFA